MLHTFSQRACGAVDTSSVAKTSTLWLSSYVQSYSRQGLRMIGMARKRISMTWPKAQKVGRAAIECDLSFLGLLALQNKLKPESAGVYRFSVYLLNFESFF